MTNVPSSSSFLTLDHITDKQFRFLAEMVHQDTGIRLLDAKRNLLEARLSKRVRSLNLPSFASYCALLEGPNSGQERRVLLSAVTTNVTSFFREDHHFKAFSQELSDRLVAYAKSGRRVRIWSAACSSGEEAWSLAMTLLEVFPDAARYDVQIMATDIDPEMIARAETGIYSSEAMSGVSSQRKERFFERADEENYRIRDALRKVVRFSELNLHGLWPFSTLFDVIFCRNCVIYFDSDDRQKLWLRFSSLLNQNGHLCVGHSERIDGPAAPLFKFEGTTIYRRLS